MTSADQKHEQPSNLARAAARGTLLTLALRLFNFTLSQITLRLVDARTLGQTSIQLELLLSSCLFLSREGFRLAFMSVDAVSTTDDNDKKRLENISLNNLSWLSALVGVFMSLFGLSFHLISNSTSKSNDLLVAGCLYCFGAVLESLSEPMLLLTIRNMQIGKRASVEGIALLIKAVSTSFFLFLMKDSFPASAFGIAQVSYGLTTLIVLYRQVWHKMQWPSYIDSVSSTNRNTSSDYFWIRSVPLHRSTLTMVGTFSIQGVFKHILTEGDKIILSFTSDSYDQGVYAMASAYGGLASRLLLQPLEENGRYFFARMKISQSKADSETDTNSNIELRRTYVVLVKLVLYIGFLFSFVGTNYTVIVLRLLAGAKWTNEDASNALAAFCYYTSVLALNGMTEAFVFGIASNASQIRNISVAHAIIGCIYGAVSTFAVAKYGTVGLIASNSFQMFLRSLYSINFADKYFQVSREKPLPRFISTFILIKEFTPSLASIVMFCITFLVTRQSNKTFLDRIGSNSSIDKDWIYHSVKHVSKGVICLFMTCLVIYKQEKSMRRFLTSMRKQKKE